jgi:hypothetical protein
MTNKFSLDIHTYLTEKMEQADAKIEDARKAQRFSDEQYCMGQQYELQELRKFLSAKFDLQTQSYY